MQIKDVDVETWEYIKVLSKVYLLKKKNRQQIFCKLKAFVRDRILQLNIK